MVLKESSKLGIILGMDGTVSSNHILHGLISLSLLDPIQNLPCKVLPHLLSLLE